jgi:hypothetical protein
MPFFVDSDVRTTISGKVELDLGDGSLQPDCG